MYSESFLLAEQTEDYAKGVIGSLFAVLESKNVAVETIRMTQETWVLLKKYFELGEEVPRYLYGAKIVIDGSMKNGELKAFSNEKYQ